MNGAGVMIAKGEPMLTVSCAIAARSGDEESDALESGLKSILTVRAQSSI